MRQTSTHRGVRLAAFAMLSLPLLGCPSDSPTAISEPVDPAGVWTFSNIVTVANGVCDGEEGESSNFPITIVKTGSGPNYAIIASGFLGNPDNILTGTFGADNHLRISGSYSEDGGTTSPMHDLSATSANRMEGTETWNWTGPGGSCPDSSSSVTANRIS